MRGISVALGALLTVSGCSSTSGEAAPSSVQSIAAPPVVATTTPPGGRMAGLFCQLSTQGGPYYVQMTNLSGPGKGMCTAATSEFTQEQFQAIPGLSRRCTLDRDEQIAQKHALVSIYSDGTRGSAQASRVICNSSGNPFTE